MSEDITNNNPEELEGAGEEIEEQFRYFPWAGEGVDFSDLMHRNGRAYGSYVLTGRALPDIRDGLKPVQRRIIYAMHKTNMHFNRPFQKSAMAVGEVIGKYHPHGDSAVYGTMVRLAQDFVMQTPLIDGQGNWGSVGPKDWSDPAAAARYTEARLTKLATEMTTDLRPAIVKFKPNFTERLTEPTVLPVTFPNLIVNGAEGIGWGMACSIPTHNLGEVIDAVIALMDDPEIQLKKLMKKLPAPDFPTGGIIVDRSMLEDAYATGKGRVRVQGKHQIEQLGGNTQGVLITELPPGVSPDQIVAEVKKKAIEGKITEVTENAVNLSDKSGATKIRVKCKRGGNIHKLVADLLQYTSMQTTQTINFTVLVDGRPEVVSLTKMLEAFIEFRQEIVTNRLTEEMRKLLAELDRLLVELATIDIIDQVIKIIRNSDDDDNTRKELMAKIQYTPYGKKAKKTNISADQAQWIMDMPLKKINRLSKFDTQEKAKTRITRIEEIEKILSSKEGINDIIRAELKDVKKSYATPRTTLFSDGVSEASATGGKAVQIASAPAEDIFLWVASNGNAISQPRKGDKLPKSPILKIKGDSQMVAGVQTRSDVQVLVFSAQGACYRTSLLDVPISTKSGTGSPIAALMRGDKVAAVFATDAEHYLIVTRQGQFKRISHDLVAPAHAGGIPVMRVDSPDEIIAVLPHGKTADVLMCSSQGKVLRVEINDKLRVVKSGIAAGVAAMKLAPGDEVVSAVLADNDTLLTLHETGMGKRVALTPADYPTKGRGGGGVQSSDPKKPTRAPAGLINFAHPVPKNGEVTLLTASGELMALNVADIPLVGRATVVKPALTLGPGDFVVDIL